MPKTPKKRIAKPNRREYSQTSVELALKAVASGKSIREAATKYGVPSSTLFGKAKAIYPVNATMGPNSVLTVDEEQQLVDWIFHISEKGFPVNKEQLLNSVQVLITGMKRETPFTNNRPGRHWYEAFCRRHPELTVRIGQNLTYSRASATKENVRNWFQEVSEHLKSKDLLDIDPSRVYNCDECGFRLYTKADNVIVRKGPKAVTKIVNTDEKESLTTLFMVNAAGTMIPPMVMYGYKRMPSSVIQNVPSDWSTGTSDKGWMTSATFFEYISNVFYPWLQKNNVEFPVVLFIDGRSSHCTLTLSNFCKEVKIELIALYPNAKHILQPLDVGVFHPLKTAWKRTLNLWRLENNGVRLMKEEFAPLLKTAVDSLDLVQTVKNGFQSCGLAPFSPDAVDFNIPRKGITINDESCNDAPITVETEYDFAEHLKLMEQQLPSQVLNAFKESDHCGVYIGELMNEGLYQYWLKIRKLAVDNGSTAIQSMINS